MLEYAPDAIIINGFSKYFCMTGWRLGWLIMPQDLIRPIERLAQNLFISAPALSQEAALTAFDCSNELDLRLDVYKKNREALLLNSLPAAGSRTLRPDRRRLLSLRRRQSSHRRQHGVLRPHPG